MAVLTCAHVEMEETNRESRYAIDNCTMRASGTVPASGLSNLQ